MAANPSRDVSFRAGVFVLVAGLLLIAGVLTLGKREQLWSEQHPFWCKFENARGLTPGADVRVAGVAAGNVRTVEVVHLPGSKTAVHVMMDISHDYLAFVKSDSVASIRTLGPLGDKYVEITLGSGQSRELSPREEIKTAEPLDFYELAEEMRDAVGRVNTFSKKLGDALADFKDSGIIEEAKAATTAVRKLVEQTEKGPSLINSVFFDKDLPKSLNNLAETARIFRKTAEEMDKGKGNLGELVHGKKVEKTLGDLAEATASLKRIAREIETGKGLTHALIYEERPKQALQDISDAARSAKNVLGAVEKGDGMAHALIYDKGPRQALDDLTKASKQLSGIFAEIEKGKGTLGLLITDPAIWESLTRLLGGAEESRVLKLLLKRATKSGKAPPEKPDPGAT